MWEQQQRLEMAARYSKQNTPPQLHCHSRSAQTDAVIVIDDHGQQPWTTKHSLAADGIESKPKQLIVEPESRWRLLDSIVMREFAQRPPKSLLWLLRTIRAIYDDKYAM